MDAKTTRGKNLPEVQERMVEQSEEEIKKEKERRRHHEYWLKHRDKILAHRKSPEQWPKEYAMQQRAKAKNPEKYREHKRQYEKKNLAKVRTGQRAWRAQNREKERIRGRAYYAINKEKMLAKESTRRKGLRTAAFLAYGGAFCKCCGETIEEFLAIDHIHNGRGNPAKRQGTGANYYQWLKTNNYPKGDFQVLCHSCNGAKAYYGVCPHQKLKTPIEEYFEQRQRNETDLNLN